MLERMLAAKPDDSEILFLLATIAVAQKDYDTAISLFRRILVREPDAERVRLELARAFFLKGDYDNADRQFRFARAGDIDDTVKANIDHFLAAINRLREWTVNFSLALAPDTNQNAATSAAQVNIFGLPFALDKSARKQSGIGVAGDIGGEWSPLLSDNVKGTHRRGPRPHGLQRRPVRRHDAVAAMAGRNFCSIDWDVSVLGTGFQRWYANQDYLSGFGGKIAADYGITSDLLISAAFGGQAVTDDFIPRAKRAALFGQLAGTYVLSPSSLFQLQLGFNRQDAQIGAYSYSGVWFGGGYSQDLPFGFSAGFQPSYFITRYDDALAAFGTDPRRQCPDAGLHPTEPALRLSRLHAAIFLCLHRAAQQHSALQFHPQPVSDRADLPVLGASKNRRPMSAYGAKRTWRRPGSNDRFLPKADIPGIQRYGPAVHRR